MPNVEAKADAPKRNYWLYGAIGAGSIILIMIIGSMINGNGFQGSLYNLETGEITQTVEVAGKVQAADEVDLAFETGGKIIELKAEIGDLVEEGEVMAKINSADLQADKNDALASLSNARAQYSQRDAAIAAEEARIIQLEAELQREEAILRELQRGTRVEELAIAETGLENANNSFAEAEAQLNSVKEETAVILNNLYDGVADTVNEGYDTALDVLSRLTAEMFNNPMRNNPTLNFLTSNSGARISAENLRSAAIVALANLESTKDEVTQILTVDSSQHERLDAALNETKSALETVRSFLVDLNIVIDSEANLSDTQEGTYRDDVNTARTNVTSAITNINSQIQSISNQKVQNQTAIANATASFTTAQNDIDTKEREFDLKKAGSTLEQREAQEATIAKIRADILTQEARVKEAIANRSAQGARINQAQAQVAKADARLNEAEIKAPFAGIISAKNYSIGEIVPANTAVYTLISSAGYEITADIPEVDIAKISVGNKASVYVDAYGKDEIFETVITKAEPADRIVEGLSKYRVTLMFITPDERIKSGMTANITIRAAERSEAIAVPIRALIEREGKVFVRVVNEDERYGENSKTALKRVLTGLIGENGTIEIVSGLRPDDTVLISDGDE